MSNRLPVIVVFLMLLLPVFNVYAGGKQPKIEDLTVVSSNEIQASFDWSKTEDRLGRQYALYRAEADIQASAFAESGGKSIASEPQIYRFIAAIPVPPVGRDRSLLVDASVAMGKIYYYQVFYLADGAMAETLPRIIDVSKNLEKRINKSSEKPVATKLEKPYEGNSFFPIPTTDKNKIKIDFEITWNGELAGKNYSYGLYRAMSSDAVFEKISNLTYDASIPADAGVLFGNEYFYQIYYVSNDEKLLEQNLPQTVGRELLKNDITVTVAMPQEPPADTLLPDTLPDTSLPPGIYTGIISFANDALDLTNYDNNKGVKVGGFVLLDSRVRTDALLELFNREYKLSSNSGNAMYYAIHKALVNTYNNIADGKLPSNLNSINIVVITNNVDNSSSAPELKNIGVANYRISNEERLRNGYSTQLPQFINTPMYGREINTWTLILPGSNVTTDRELDIISNNQNSLRHISYETKNFVVALKEIANNLKQQTEQATLVAVMPSYYNGARVTIRIDAFNSITGTILFEGDKHYLSDIKCEPPDILTDLSRVEGVPEAGEYAYHFTLARNFLPNDLPSKEISEHSVYLRVKDKLEEADNAFIRIYRDTKVQRGSAVVYFVLDCEKSLGTDGIKKINEAVTSVINDMFEKTVGDRETIVPEKSINAYPQYKKYTDADLKKLIRDAGDHFWTPKLMTRKNFEEVGSLAFWVQIGAYDDHENAAKTRAILRDNNYGNADIIDAGGIGRYKVCLGPYSNLSDAEKALKALRDRGK